MQSIHNFIEDLAWEMNGEFFSKVDDAVKALSFLNREPGRVPPAELLPEALCVMYFGEGERQISSGAHAAIEICEGAMGMSELRRLQAACYIADFNKPLTSSQQESRNRAEISSSHLLPPLPDGKIAVRAGMLISRMMSDIGFATSLPSSLALEAHLTAAQVLTVAVPEGRLAVRNTVIVIRGDHDRQVIDPALKRKVGWIGISLTSEKSPLGIAFRDIVRRYDHAYSKVLQGPTLDDQPVESPEATVTNFGWFKANVLRSCAKPRPTSLMRLRLPPQIRLTPELMMLAYSRGMFPMAEDAQDTFLHWLDPDPRGVLPLETFHVPRQLARSVRRQPYQIRVDGDFAQVIHRCGPARPDGSRTWLNHEIAETLKSLHAQGHAHSVEAWRDGRMVGGLYGVALGAAFFGESMFSTATDASKIALVHLVARLARGGFMLHDCQFVTDHLKQFGAIEIPRDHYRRLLQTAVRQPADYGVDTGTAGEAELVTAFLQSRTQIS